MEEVFSWLMLNVFVLLAVFAFAKSMPPVKATPKTFIPAQYTSAAALERAERRKY